MTNNFKIEICFADLGKRTLAYLLDVLILFVFIMAIIFVMGSLIFLFTSIDENGEPPVFLVLISVLGYIFLPFVGVFYFALFESSEKQATLGKQAMGLKVVTEYGARLTFLNALGRNLARMLSGVLFIGYILAFVNQNRQSLHDMLAKTHVVDRVLFDEAKDNAASDWIE